MCDISWILVNSTQPLAILLYQLPTLQVVWQTRHRKHRCSRQVVNHRGAQPCICWTLWSMPWPCPRTARQPSWIPGNGWSFEKKPVEHIQEAVVECRDLMYFSEFCCILMVPFCQIMWTEVNQRHFWWNGKADLLNPYATTTSAYAGSFKGRNFWIFLDLSNLAKRHFEKRLHHLRMLLTSGDQLVSRKKAACRGLSVAMLQQQWNEK